MPEAIRVREDNLEMIVDYARERGFNLDYLRDEMQYMAEDGFDLMLITDGSEKSHNITFTTFSDAGFKQTWKFTDHENPNKFIKIERV